VGLLKVLAGAEQGRSLETVGVPLRLVRQEVLALIMAMFSPLE
jgi:hypothetical protein